MRFDPILPVSPLAPIAARTYPSALYRAHADSLEAASYAPATASGAGFADSLSQAAASRVTARQSYSSGYAAFSPEALMMNTAYIRARTRPPVDASKLSFAIPSPTPSGTPRVQQGRDTASPFPGVSSLYAAEDDAAPEPGEGCAACDARVYKDRSDDAGVSFSSARGTPAATAGIAIASHEGEHVSRGVAAAQREGRVVTGKKVTMSMAFCPDCGRMYFAGGTTTLSTVSRRDPGLYASVRDARKNAAPTVGLSMDIAA